MRTLSVSADFISEGHCSKSTLRQEIRSVVYHSFIKCFAEKPFEVAARTTAYTEYELHRTLDTVNPNFEYNMHYVTIHLGQPLSAFIKHKRQMKDLKQWQSECYEHLTRASRIVIGGVGIIYNLRCAPFGKQISKCLQHSLQETYLISTSCE